VARRATGYHPNNVVRIRQVYDKAEPGDGRRVLVDRLWPRGLRRDPASFDEWLRAVAPSDGLRRWYRHEPALFAEFTERYLAELDEPERAVAVRRLREYATTGPLTLLTATRDVEHSHAAVLLAVLDGAESVGGSS
jgi:uncharacterized protein YeaO (DUF488 family)